MHESHTISEERFEFTASIRNKVIIVGVIGVVLFALGILLGGSGSEGHGGEHGAIQSSTSDLVASLNIASSEAGTEEGHGGGHEPAGMLTRIKTSLWHNNIFFTGIGIIGLFFIAIQYAAQAGWSAQVKRIPLAIGHWIPIAGILTIALYFFSSQNTRYWNPMTYR